LELHCSVVNIPQEFKAIVATSIGLIKDKPIQIRTELPEDLPWVWADPTRMPAIILNLMSNAIKFTESGSEHFHAHMEGEVVQVSVMDTGIGIPEKALEHILTDLSRLMRIQNSITEAPGWDWTSASSWHACTAAISLCKARWVKVAHLHFR